MDHRMAILVDGGFYLTRAKHLKGDVSPEERADELVKYCHAHARHEHAEIYRIFYYDCDPIDKQVYHPLHDRTFNSKTFEQYKWKHDFFRALSRKRKVALRKGQPLESSCRYVLKQKASEQLVKGARTVDSLTDDDFILDVQQKGVDVRIGLDLALITLKGYANQIVLITGDSDFVPAAKFARRNGVDFILDPMWHQFRDELAEQLDGLFTPWPDPRKADKSKADGQHA